MTFYKCFKAVLRFIFLPLFRVKIIGKEKFPNEGACIYYANHLSNWDPVFMHLAIDRKPRFMAKKELFKNPILRGIVKYFGAFSVDRGKGDLGAFQNAFKVIEEGEVVGIYPEGKRAKDGIMKNFHTGVSIIAARTGAIACPLYISGKFKPFKKTYMIFGEPVDLKDKFGEIKLSDHETVKATAEHLRQQLVKLKDEMKL